MPGAATRSGCPGWHGGSAARPPTASGTASTTCAGCTGWRCRRAWRSAIAWAGALWLIGTPSPVFAPTAAVATIASSAGRRLRRSIELIVGIVLGIGVGNAFVEAVGAGFWQMGVIVTLAILAAVGLGGSVPVVNQAAVDRRAAGGGHPPGARHRASPASWRR